MSYTFSTHLEHWLRSPGKKTLAGLENVFGEKSFAIAFLLLMSPAALPLPTGGVTHLFEIVVILLAIELVAGRETLWLPKRWRNLTLGSRAEKKFLPFLVRRIRWFEHFSRPRWQTLASKRWYRSIVGLIVIFFTLAAFIAPPFSGLDTLPALAVVAISLALILEDIAIFIIGIFIGTAGVGLIIGLGSAITQGIRHLF